MYARLDKAKQKKSNENKHPRVCAICVKEPIMIHSDDKDCSISTQKDEVEQLEEKLVSGTNVKIARAKGFRMEGVRKLHRDEKERKQTEQK